MKKIGVIIVFFLCGFFAVADEETSLSDTLPEVKVKLDSGRSQIFVHVKKDPKKLPQSLQIVLLDQKGQRTVVELKATDPWAEGGVLPSSPQSYFSGKLQESGQAYVGFELKFPLPTPHSK